MNAGRKPIVILLGMHRSGTSLAMSMLNALGVECGEALIPAGPGNPAGFWEHSAIVAAQEDLLAGMDRMWHGPRGTHPFRVSQGLGRLGRCGLFISVVHVALTFHYGK